MAWQSRRFRKRQWLYPVEVLLSTVLFFGCTIGPDFTRPNSGLEQATLTPKKIQSDVIGTTASDIPPNWWALFNDPMLTWLEEQAQATNLDLQIASARIEESQSQLGIVSARLWPTIGNEASYAREALSEHGKFAALGAPTNPSSFWQLGFNSSWEIDLWGRSRRANESAAATLESTEYDKEAIRVSLSAEVARIYLKLRETQAQIGIVKSSQEIAERVLALMESRKRNGVVTRFDIATARREVAMIKAMVPELSQPRNALINTLALFLGDRPRTLDAKLSKTMPLPELPKMVPVGLSSDIARRRPDIQGAEAQLHAAVAAIGVAKADLYPRVNLTG
jgi:NodT family efflux transporter outer membrane factor (OMF) lipoprotein